MAERRVRRPASRAVALLLPLLSLLQGCAHRAPAPAPLDSGALERRHSTLLAERHVRTRGTVGEVSVWFETATQRFPGAHASYRLVGPDSVRLRVESSFGTALDLAGAGDSLWLWVPSERAGVRAGPGDAPLSRADAAAFAVRAAAALWAVPGAAWRAARAADTLTVARWIDSGDTLELAVGSNGLPRTARLLREGMRPVRVAYAAYGDHQGTPWPVRFDLEDEGGAFRLQVRVRRVYRDPAAAAAPWRPVIPAGARSIEAEELWQRIRDEWAP
jgi:hypothetical protein